MLVLGDQDENALDLRLAGRRSAAASIGVPLSDSTVWITVARFVSRSIRRNSLRAASTASIQTGRVSFTSEPCFRFPVERPSGVSGPHSRRARTAELALRDSRL